MLFTTLYFFFVDGLCIDEKVSFVRLNPKKDTTASLYNPVDTDTIQVSFTDGDVTASFAVTANPGEAFALTLKKGVEYTLTA